MKENEVDRMVESEIGKIDRKVKEVLTKLRFDGQRCPYPSCRNKINYVYVMNLISH